MVDIVNVIIVVGTRPNFIKVTQFEEAFANYNGRFNYKLVHTGQHFDHKMSDVFFEKLKLKKPDFHLNIQESDRSLRLERMYKELSALFEKESPDLVVVVGDVDSTLAAAKAAKKNDIKLAHVESGLRSFDQEMPEEVNRIEVDQLADFLFVTEKSGLENLETEGRERSSVFFVGNTMIDTLIAFEEEIKKSNITEKLGVTDTPYVLVTMHRPRNVDNQEVINKLLEVFNFLVKDYKLVFPIHPRTKEALVVEEMNSAIKEQLILTEPLDYIEFQKLIADASFVLTDSGGIQEETTFRKVPCITLRENTERPSTLESGCNQLCKIGVEEIKQAVKNLEGFKSDNVEVPELWDGDATKRIVEQLDKLF